MGFKVNFGKSWKILYLEGVLKGPRIGSNPGEVPIFIHEKNYKEMIQRNDDSRPVGGGRRTKITT